MWSAQTENAARPETRSGVRKTGGLLIWQCTILLNTRRLRAASRTVPLLVWSRGRPCNRQMPTAQYGHDSEPEAKECTHDHDYKGRVVHGVSHHHNNAGSKRGDSIKIQHGAP